MANWSEQIDFFHVKANENDPNSMRWSIDRIEQTLQRLRDSLQAILAEAENQITEINTTIISVNTDIGALEQLINELRQSFAVINGKAYYSPTRNGSGWVCLSHWE